MLRYRRKKKGHSRGKWLLLSVLLLVVLAAVLFLVPAACRKTGEQHPLCAEQFFRGKRYPKAQPHIFSHAFPHANAFPDPFSSADSAAHSRRRQQRLSLRGALYLEGQGL